MMTNARAGVKRFAERRLPSFNHRDFELRVPASTRGPWGVVFAWHHAGGSSAFFPRVLADHLDPPPASRGSCPTIAWA